MKRVVVTGMGAVSPVGNSPTEVWQNIVNGNSGITEITLFDHSDIGVSIAGEVHDLDFEKWIDRRTMRRTDRSQQFALIAAMQAMEDSGLDVTEDNQYDIGCVVGTGIGGISTMADQFSGYFEKGQRGVSPLKIAPLLSDQISSQISIDLNLRGPNYAIISACASGNNTLGDAVDMIRLGRAKAMFAGGSEACVTPMVLSGYDNIKALSHYDGDPAGASRPFDAERDGFVAGEGAAILVLEELEHAKARGATIYAEITGYGHTSDAYHVTAPRDNGESAAMAVTKALEDAHLSVEDIDYINAHGTATPLNDASETTAIKRALGQRAYDIPVSSTKSMTGHMQGAAGAIEALITVEAIRNHAAPPTINLHNPDPDCDLDYVPNEARDFSIRHAMTNAFGFGGHNAVLILSAYDE